MKSKGFCILITFVCILLLLILQSITILGNEDISEVGCAPPEVNTDGLRHPAKVTVVEDEPEKIEYEMYFDESDVIAVAQMLWGEARGCSTDNQIKAVWCVVNRVDDSRFSNTVTGVVSAPGQFYGYSPNNPVWDNLKDVARDVLTRWSLEKQGADVERELPKPYMWFTGNGVENIFREVY